jgi:hypothetical protein
LDYVVEREAPVRANEDSEQQIESSVADSTAAAPQSVAGREPYTSPVIERFPPMGNVTFGTTVQPMLAMSLAGT